MDSGRWGTNIQIFNDVWIPGTFRPLHTLPSNATHLQTVSQLTVRTPQNNLAWNIDLLNQMWDQPTVSAISAIPLYIPCWKDENAGSYNLKAILIYQQLLPQTLALTYH